VREVVEGPRLGAVGHDGGDAPVVGGRGNGDLGAGREAEHADVANAAALEEVDGRLDVRRPVPAEGVRPAAARAASALVVQQNAVAVVREQRRVQLEAVAVGAAAVNEDHRGAVAGRDVPGGEATPSAVRSVTSSCGTANVRTGTRGLPLTQRAAPIGTTT
jgi:hypothetical protein